MNVSACGNSSRHARLGDLPQRRVAVHEPREQVDAVGDVPRLVPLHVREALAQAGHELVPLEGEEVAPIAGLGEDALHDHVVGHGRPDLRLRGVVVTEAVHRGGQLLVEDRAVARRVEAVKVAVGAADLVEEAPEELDVLALLEQERRQEQLLLEPALLRDHHDQREEVERDALLARLEERRDLEDRALLVAVQAAPQLAVAREVDGGGIPGAQPLRLLIQAHRQRVEVEPAGAGRPEGGAAQSSSR